MISDEIFNAFSAVSSTASGKHIYDYIGTATRVAYKQSWVRFAVRPGASYTPGHPPKDEHYLDWIALLRCVERASATFRMVELGAGWAPWLVRGMFAARQRREITAIELVGVEADPTHYAWMRQHFADNGIDPDAHTLLSGAISGNLGTVAFPEIDQPDIDYGASPGGAAIAERTIDVPSFTIRDVLERLSGPVDLMHIDIQGAEYEALPAAIDAISARVRCILVGTHRSDVLHDEMVEVLTSSGLREILNLARNRTHVLPFGEFKIGDGFLLFDNPNLT